MSAGAIPQAPATMMTEIVDRILWVMRKVSVVARSSAISPMAGFDPIIYGQFWVITEELRGLRY